MEPVDFFKSLKHRKTQAFCERVIDGDTVIMTMELPGLLAVPARFSCRLFGYNAPEIHSGPPEVRVHGIACRFMLEKLMLYTKFDVTIIDLSYERLVVSIDSVDIRGHMLSYAPCQEHTGRNKVEPVSLEFCTAKLAEPEYQAHYESAVQFCRQEKKGV